MAAKARCGRILWGMLLVAGCGGEPGDGPGMAEAGFCDPLLASVDSFLAASAETAPRGDRYGGTAVVSGLGDLGSLNALVSNDYASRQHQMFVSHLTLLRYGPALEPEPWLARSWEVAADTTAVTFHLRDDVFWHDGRRTTAEDVAFTWVAMTDPETGYPNPSFWDHWVPGREGVEVVDSLTVRIRLRRPHAEILDPWTSSAILPAHLLADVPSAELRDHPYGSDCPVGNGPFAFQERRSREGWTFVANPALPEALGGRPYLDRYVYRVVPEPATALAEILTGGTHVYLQPSAAHAEEIQAASDVRLRHFPSREFVFVGWNARREALSDARVRRALTLGIDREAFVRTVAGGWGVVARSTVPPSHWASDPEMEGVLDHDPEAARQLLDEAGWRDRDGDGVREDDAGTPLAFTVKLNEGSDSRRAIAELMQAQLRDVGVAIRPEVVEFNTLLGQVTDPERREFDGIVLGWTSEFRIDDRDLFHSEWIDQPFAFAGTRNPELDRLLDTLPLVPDREAARPLWARYQRLLAEEQPFTFFYFVERLAGVRDELRDVEMDVRGEWLNVGEWWLEPGGRDRGRP